MDNLMANPRYAAWVRLGRPGGYYGLWVREEVTRWAIANGFVSDTSAPYGVQVLTQHEANGHAMASLGGDAFDAHCRAL